MINIYLLGSALFILVATGIIWYLIKRSRNRLFSQMEFIWSPNFFASIVKEVSCINNIKTTFEYSNKQLEEIELPQAVLDYNKESAEDLIKELNEVFKEENFQKSIRKIHHRNLPFLLNRNLNDTLILLRDCLISEVPRATHLIFQAWRKARDEKNYKVAIALFWEHLFKDDNKNSNVHIELKKFLTQCLSLVITGKSSDTSSTSMPGSYRVFHNQEDSIDQEAFGISLIEIGLFTGFAYYILDFDDVFSADAADSISQYDVPDVDSTTVAIDSIDADHVGTLGFPFVATLIEGFKQANLLWSKKTNFQNAALHFSVKIAGKSTGAVIGMKTGGAIGTVIFPGIGTVVGGLGGGILGAFGITKLIRKWQIQRYENAKREYDAKRQEADIALKNCYKDYYRSIQQILKKFQENLCQDRRRLELKISFQENQHVARTLKEALRKDIESAEEWKKRIGKAGKSPKLADKMILLNDFLVTSKRLIQQLDHISPDKLTEILTLYKNMPIIKEGAFHTQQTEVKNQITHWNARVALGVASWVLAIQGLYGKTLQSITKEGKAPRRKLSNTQQLWNNIVQEAMDKVYRELAQLT